MLNKRKVGLLCLAVVLIFGLVGCSLDEAYVQRKAEEAEITPSAGPPVAKFSPSFPEVRAGGLIFFDTKGSTTPNRWIESAAWDFGDGTTKEGTWFKMSFVSHIYAESRSYTVTLTVTDNKGEKATTHRTILVY